MEAGRGFRNARFFRDGNEGAQMPEVHNAGESIPVPYVYMSKVVLDSVSIRAHGYAVAVWTKPVATIVWGVS